MQKLGAIVANNASLNNTFYLAIEGYMLNEQDLEWEAKHWRIRCSGHIINLAVQAFLFANVIEMEELELYNAQDRAREIGDEEAKELKF